MGLLMIFLLSCAMALAASQYDNQYSTTTPMHILKQINRHYDDGSYSYGYENADGSYKIESKYPTGEVYGKYGFVDNTGSVREIEYGATRRGFEPRGTGINVPPSTLTGNRIPDANEPEDDGQYREDPSIYYTDPKYTNGERYEPVEKHRQQQRYQQQSAPPAAYNPPPSRYPEHRPSSPASLARYQPEYRPEYRTQYQPKFETNQYQQSALRPESQFQGHSQSASNIDLHAGSYTVNYKR